MQNKYGKSASGVNGIVNCINKLIQLKSDLTLLFPHGCGGSEMFVEVFNDNLRQSCCLISMFTPDKLKRLSIAFGLEWDSNIIIGIVFLFNVDHRTYIRQLYDMTSSEEVRAPTVWDLEVIVVGAVISSAELDEIPSKDLNEQYIFLHSIEESLDADSPGTPKRRATLSEVSLRKSPSSKAFPSRSCLKSDESKDGVEKSEGDRTVKFATSRSVVLVPEVKARPNDGIHYSPIDFRRFSADADEDLEATVKRSNSKFMDKVK